MKTKIVKTKDGEKIKLEIIENSIIIEDFIFYIKMEYIQKQIITALL